MAAYNKESLVFDYGNGKPKITYYNNEDDITKMDTYRIYFSNKLNTDNNNSNFYEIQIPNQKWNNFVFNYNSKYVDLFINGKLTRTFYFKETRMKRIMIPTPKRDRGQPHKTPESESTTYWHIR